MAIVTLTTDFGLDDTWVGQVKGALLEVDPSLTCVDLCHAVPAHDVAAGAWLLECGSVAFPSRTIHVAIVDPGVGTARAGLAVRTERYDFVAPDNGLLTRVLERERALAIHRLDRDRLRRPGAGTTFDGRDLFAPAAARLALGEPPGSLGPPAADPLRLPLRAVEPVRGAEVEVDVAFVDRFGNVALDIRAAALSRALGGPVVPGCRLRVEAGGQAIETLRSSFEGGGDAPFLLVNSADYLEIAVERGRADAALGLRRGDRVRLTVL